VLDLPLVAKDTIKETLHDALGGDGRARSQQLGAATFEVMYIVLRELLAHGCSAITEGNFARAEPFRALPPARIAQVHVTAPPELLRERFLGRMRHPVHYDDEVVDEVPERVAAGEWDALDIGGRLIEVDGSAPIDAASLAVRIMA
jgi:predicted kinase